MSTETPAVIKQQIFKMLELQDAMNAKVNAEWRLQGYAWYRAIWVESAEMLDHFGWKWWKKQNPDVAQVELELVDIWHFGLSDMLQRSDDSGALADALAEELLKDLGEVLPFREQLEAFVAVVLTKKAFDLAVFCQLMKATSFSFERLYLQYMGKNVLNFFRQDHGYKDGTYHKIWSGREDNEHLVEVLAEIPATSSSFQADVYAALELRYPRN